MRKRMLSALLSLCLAVSSQTVVFAAPDVFEGGSNVEGFLAPIDDPDASAIRIKTPQDLAAVSENMRGSYILMNDIDLTEYGNWSVIGKTLANPFQGKFDGQGHTISGLTVSVSFDSGTLLAPTYAVGLFGVCDGAQIKNLALENVNISISTASGYRYENSILDSDGTVFAGAIAGYLKNSSVIYNCTASGSVSASASDEGYSPTVAGGLIGFGDTAVLSYCHNAADVTAYNGNSYQAENSYAGGLAGRFEKECIIDRSYNGGAVSARTLDYGISYAGGLIADASKSIATVTDSFNEGNVQSISGNQFCDPAYAGGIAAQFLGSINRTYNSGTVCAQANDPYDINSTKAYAGGICGSTYPAATISNVAIVQAVVSATASGQRYQSRIADSGTKTNTISIRTMSAGSNNDAEIIKDLDDMKQAKPYEEELGWDFTRVWEMVSGHEFPQLKQVDTSSEEYNQDYVDQHLDFIDSGKYQQIMDRYRWAQIYWSQENNFESNLAGALYSGADAIVDIATLNLGALFDEGNPFKVLLADYISDQTVEQAVVELYKVKIPFALDKKYKAAKGFIQKHWKDGWGELSDEDLFWLFHYEDKPSEEWINENFENHISEIVEETRNSGEDLAKVLEITTETLDTILEQKKNLDNAVDWLNGLIKYSGHVAAYLQADAEFKTILEEMCGNLPEFTPLEAKYKVQLYTALKSYTQYNNSQHLASRIFLNYLIDSTVGSFADTIKKTINSQVSEWIKGTFSAAAVQAINKIGWAADRTWKICEYVTKNGELQECREMLKANAYFEKTMYNTLETVKSRFLSSQSFENACLFDAAFKFLKETEICSMDTVMSYLDTYQLSWFQAIRNRSNTFMNSAIEEVTVNKLFLYKTYCHGMSYNIGGKVITIACPTDVSVYTEDGTLAALIEEGEVRCCAEDVLAYSADAVKLILVPADQDYSIMINATESGEMSYSVSEYDSTGSYVQTTIYPDIAITEGDSFTGAINDEIRTDPESYQLEGDDGKAIGSGKLITTETNIPVESVTIISAIDVLSVGETVSLKAAVSPDTATIQSVAWSSSDTTVVSVSENGTLTAVGEGTATVSAQSVYGGAADSVEVTVLAAGRSLLIQADPQGAVYSLNEEAEPLSVRWYEKDANSQVSLQWYVADSLDTAGEAVSGAVESSFVPDTSEIGTRYYYVTVSDGSDTRTSARAAVEVTAEKTLASGTTDSGITWEVTDSLLLRITGTGDLAFAGAGSAPWAEYQETIRSVEIADGIASIGVNALTGMASINSLSIPASVQQIAPGALSGCSGLTSLSIPFIGTSRDAHDSRDSVLGAIFGQTSGTGVEQYYSLSGTSLSGSRYGIPATLTDVSITDAACIPFGAFYNCSGLKSITLNDGITSIGGYAFCGCSRLEELTLPDEVADIGSCALKGCSGIQSLTIPFVGAAASSAGSSEAVLGYFFGADPNGIVQYYTQTESSLSGSRFAIPGSLKAVIVTKAETIPFGAFSNCDSLERVKLNNGIKRIDGYSFYQCSCLTSAIVPDSVKMIAESAFEGCNALTELTVPFVGANRSVSGTYEGALGYIFGRTSDGESNTCVQYSILDGTSLSGYAYAIPDSLVSVTVTDASQLPIGSFSNLNHLKTLTLNPDISVIDAYAFYNAKSLTDIYYQDTKNMWDLIEIRSGNDTLKQDAVTIHYLDKPIEAYTISYNANGGTGTMAKSIATQGQAFTLPANGFTAPNGQRFKAWKIGNKEYQPGAKYTFTEDAIVTAVWENIPIEKETLEVIWLDSDGAELDRKTYHTGEVEPVTKHKPSDSDTAIFVGWNNGTINGTVKTYAPVMATPVYHPTDPSAPGIALSGSEGVVNVALRAPGSNGRIFYTIDGSKPDPASEDTLQYEGCFQVEHSATIRAIAISEGKSSSVTLLKVAVGDQVKSDSSVFIGEAVFFNADGDVINAVGQLENEKMIQVSLCACQERQEEIGDEATILLAVYDLNGRMMDMQSRTSEVRDSKLLLIESVALPEGSIGSVRLFIVDRMMRPLTTVQQIN